MSAFNRQLGSQSGVQLNAPVDNSDLPTTDNSDQYIATAARFTRGRIDQPFVVTRSNFKRLLGSGEPIRANELNRAYPQIKEALDRGASGFVIHRLVPQSTAFIGWAVASVNGSTIDVQSSEHVLALGPSELTIGDRTLVVGGANVTTHMLAVKHKECFNDGFRLAFHADEKFVNGEPVANDVITLQIRDNSGQVLWSFTGSLIDGTLDDYGNSFYLPDVVETATDLVEVQVNNEATGIAPDSHAYGYTATGQVAWIESDTVVTFTEGGTDYVQADYDRARTELVKTPIDFGLIWSGATEAVGLLSNFVLLSYLTNLPCAFDVPGDLTPEAAKTWKDQFAPEASDMPGLLSFFWCPVKSNCPVGINPKGFFGAAALNLAFAAKRNAVKNRQGMAAKHYAIAGSGWPISRINASQSYTPEPYELDFLAKNRINPVVYEKYSDGIKLVFLDSLTASTKNSLAKLISVSHMSSHIEIAAARICKSALQLPMEDAIEAASDGLLALLEAAEQSRWLVASDELDGEAFRFTLTPDPQNPYDRMIMAFSTRYNGTHRQTEITQTFVR